MSNGQHKQKSLVKPEQVIRVRVWGLGLVLSTTIWQRLVRMQRELLQEREKNSYASVVSVLPLSCTMSVGVHCPRTARHSREIDLDAVLNSTADRAVSQ